MSYQARRFVLVSWFLVLGSSVQAQRFDAALIAGFNASQVDGDDLAGYHKLGLNAGAKAYARFTDNFSLGLELLISQKGSKSRLNPSNPANTFKLRLDYAEVPVLLHYHDRDRAIFGVGVSYSALVNYKQVEGGINVTGDPPVFSRDLNILLDLAIRIKKNFGLNFRYGYSIIPIEYWQGSNLKNNSVYNNLIAVRFMWFPKAGE